MTNQRKIRQNKSEIGYAQLSEEQRRKRLLKNGAGRGGVSSVEFAAILFSL